MHILILYLVNFFKKNNYILIYYLLFFLLSSLFILSISSKYYPDNKNLQSRLIEGHKELKFIPQQVFVNSYNFFQNKFNCNKKKETNCKIFGLNNLNRYIFFISTFFVFLLLCTINNFFYNEDQQKRNKNNIVFVSSLCFPSVLISITSIGSEAIFTLISIFIMLNIQHLRKCNFESFILVILGIYSFYLDRGNSLIFLSFLIGLICLVFLRKFVKLNSFLFLMLIISSVALFMGTYLFAFIGNMIDVDKITGLYLEVIKLNLNDITFLDVASRFIYFWATLITFLFPNKSFLSSWLIIVTISIIVFFVKKENRLIFFQEIKLFFLVKYNQVIFIWLLLFPAILINILPTHAYAKYYLFYIPILITILRNFFKTEKVFFVIFLSGLISLVEYIIIN